MKDTLVRELLDSLASLKGANLKAFALGPHHDLCSWHVVASARSSRQLRSMANAVAFSFKRRGLSCHREGMESGHWILLDGGEVLVHLFLEEKRDRYALHDLWKGSGVLSGPERPPPEKKEYGRVEDFL